jgi:hypothetical protein
VILREAVGKDYPSLARFLNVEVRRLGYEGAFTAQSLARTTKAGLRLVALWDEGMIAAVLGASPIETDTGPGYEVQILVTNRRHPDRIKALDAIVLYACNLAVSERRYRILSERSPESTAVYYGRDYAGMPSTSPQGAVGYGNDGDARDILPVILKRRPEWRISL